jgi:hypothetical protein
MSIGHVELTLLVSLLVGFPIIAHIARYSNQPASPGAPDRFPQSRPASYLDDEIHLFATRQLCDLDVPIEVVVVVDGLDCIGRAARTEERLEQGRDSGEFGRRG